MEVHDRGSESGRRWDVWMEVHDRGSESGMYGWRCMIEIGDGGGREKAALTIATHLYMYHVPVEVYKL